MKQDLYTKMHKAWMDLSKIRSKVEADDPDYDDITKAMNHLNAVFQRGIDNLCNKKEK